MLIPEHQYLWEQTFPEQCSNRLIGSFLLKGRHTEKLYKSITLKLSVQGCLKCCLHKSQQTRRFYCYSKCRSLKFYLQHLPIFSKYLHPWCTHFMIWIKSTYLISWMKTKDDLNIVYWHYRNQNQSRLLVCTRNGGKRKQLKKRYIPGQFPRLAEAKGMLKNESNCPNTTAK